MKVPEIGLHQRSRGYVAVNLDRFARMNQKAFYESPWNERWQWDPAETDPRRFSHAAIRDLCGLPYVPDGEEFIDDGGDEPYDILTAEVESIGAVGIAVGYQLQTEDDVRKFMLAPDGEFSDGGVIGDYYMALVMMQTDYRGFKIFPELVALRFMKAHQRGCRRIWMQTHQSQESVVSSYRRTGFVEARRLAIPSPQGPNGELQPSNRIILRFDTRRS